VHAVPERGPDLRRRLRLSALWSPVQRSSRASTGYDRLTCPMTIVLVGDGLDASRRDEERTIVDAALAAG
jgi:hypothetical protein